MKIKLLFFLSLLAFVACKKGAGQGGTSTIRGKIYGYSYNSNYSAKIDSGYVAKEDVFIVYGDDATFGDDVKTNYDGTYEFPYLKQGKYKIFVYTKDSTKLSSKLDNLPVISYVEIKKNKQTISVPDMVIIKN